MCGIIGIVGNKPVAPLLIEGLKRLEYRGYNSAGIATLVNGAIERRRAEGKLINLEKRAGSAPRRRQHRHRPHALGDPRHAERDGTPIRTRRTAWPWSITASSRISARSAPSWRPRATRSRPTPTPRRWCTCSPSILRTGASPAEATARTLARLEGAFALGIIFTGRDELMIGGPARLAAGHRLWRRRDVHRLGRAGAGAAHPVDLLSGGGRLGRDLGDRGAVIHDASGAVVERPSARHGQLRRADRQGQLTATSC